MNFPKLFEIANAAIVPFWVLLLVAPRAKLTRVLVHSVALPIVVGLLYTVMILTMPPLGETGDGRFSFAAVSRFFASLQGLFVGWLHYLVFDLFVGAWQTRDALRRGVTPWLRVPTLMVTLFFGPIGLMVYLGGRAVLKRDGSLDEQ